MVGGWWPVGGQWFCNTSRVWDWMMLSQIVFPKKSNSFMYDIYFGQNEILRNLNQKEWTYIKLQQTLNLNKKLTHTSNLSGGAYFSENVSDINLCGGH